MRTCPTPPVKFHPTRSQVSSCVSRPKSKSSTRSSGSTSSRGKMSDHSQDPQSKSNGKAENLTPLDLLRLEVGELQSKVARLEEVNDRNATVFADTLSMLDARTFMMLKVLDDMTVDNPSLECSSVRLAGKGVDWDHYMGLYKEAQKKEDTAPTVPAGEHPEGAVVFGGT